MEIQVLVLAAGKGTRMKSKHPKVIHRVCGLPMVSHVLRAAAEVSPNRPWVVVGFGAEEVKETVGDYPDYIIQEEQLGTGHAVMMAQERLRHLKDGNLLVLYGDTPLITAGTLRRMVEVHCAQNAAATVLTAILDQPFGYGRIIRNAAGELAGIIEEKDASAEEKNIREINTGFYCFRISALLKVLPRLSPQNAQGEYYLTDVIKLLKADGEKLATLVVEDNEEIIGPNDRKALAEVEAIMRRRILEHWMLAGVTIADPATTYIDPRVSIGQDTQILPGTILEGETEIGADCIIGPFTQLTSVKVGNGTRVSRSVLDHASVGNDVQIGPFAYLRPGTVVEDNVKIGDFVELKNAHIGTGSKVPHLSYLGDSLVGSGTNIGCGTITCNYDGKDKHQTVIGDRVFVGSNTNLVAPVVVGDEATIGAGSTITKDVPAKSLAVARSRQVVKENWLPRYRR
ncbi:MAG TPA: bifunctional UDP-N-acetylglucosamine diphosphorylase/glucosamine-1-phosphate N-acetyltransferase GlmU [Firmicutes bacterium]|jgi:bifunctional UDP-N-acetylglucosamine pyrophosphorylase/glucosamine-1-phosphate N-acetyltransferase|nr:bifunctional UDP-N-acetylglucosamine diphosphorylase/glucosamine-1-phosphate N-acetyltransferase GlmU [Bacillota bacterium]